MLEGRDLECERGGRKLFGHLSFVLAPGEVLHVRGPNGSGKSSLLRILCGLLAPNSGEVCWRSAAIERLREDYSKELFYLGHAPAVKDELTAAENLAISCRLAGEAPPGDAIEAALARFGLPANGAPVKRLSQGQRRRAALARLALSESRPLWLLDEPFAALDAEGINTVKELCAAHLGRGGAMVFTTHQDPGFTATRVVELG